MFSAGLFSDIRSLNHNHNLRRRDCDRDRHNHLIRSCLNHSRLIRSHNRRHPSAHSVLFQLLRELQEQNL